MRLLATWQCSCTVSLPWSRMRAACNSLTPPVNPKRSEKMGLANSSSPPRLNARRAFDALAREQGLSPKIGLRFHLEHSGPLMRGLHEWMEAQLAEHKTEPNSGLGKAISYVLNHWLKLTLFLRQPGVPSTTTSSNAPQESDSESQKRAVLQDDKRRRGWRSVHEPDPHLRAGRSQSVRLSERVAEACRRVEAASIGVDALELPRNSGLARRTHGGII